MKNSKDPIAVLGAGNWGTTLAILAAKNQEKVYLYDRSENRAREMQLSRENTKYLPKIKLSDRIEVTSDLKLIFSQCQLILPVIPSSHFRKFMGECAPHVRGDHFIVHGTKGLEPGSIKRMSEIIVEETGCLRVGTLSGPNIAQELAEGYPGATVVASRFEEVIRKSVNVFGSDQFRVYGNYDLVGVEWAGSLKNILAIAAGMISELRFGANTMAMMITRGLVETSRLIEAVGATGLTLNGLAGIGDVVATCTSPLSRNFRAGQMLAQNLSKSEVENKLAMTIEGLNTIKVAREIALRHRLDTPIINGLYSVVYDGAKVSDTLNALMLLPSEFEGGKGSVYL